MGNNDTKLETAMLSATAQIRSHMDPAKLAIADRMAEINSHFITFTRDERLDTAFRKMLLSLATPPTSKPDKRRILAICGASGAGKSTAIATHTSRHPALQSYIDEDGVEVHPLLVFDAPKPCTPRLLAMAGLSAMGSEVRPDIRENEAWFSFRKKLAKLKVRVVIIDEAQNAIENANVREATVIGDGFKQLVQQDWPVRLVLAGVPPLASFMARKQLRNRATFVHFEPIDPKQNLDMLETIVNRVIVKHATLTRHPSLNEEFLHRLAHACSNDLGTIIQTVRETVELVLYAGRTEVTIEDFMHVYAVLSGCKDGKNIFKADNWAEIDPSVAALRDDDEAWEAERLLAKGKRGTKYGVRPQ